jgi:hypothetical protein
MKKEITVDELGKLITNVAPVPIGYEEHVVYIDLDSPIFATYSNALYANLTQKVDAHGGRLDFTALQLFSYLQFLVVLRVMWVNGIGGWTHPAERLAVPPYMTLLLASIGIVSEPRLGLELKPGLCFAGLDVPNLREFQSTFPKEDAYRFSNILKGLSTLGLDYAEGFPTDKRGSWEFMTFVVQNNVVTRYDATAHPGLAVCAATMNLRGAESVLLPRVSYGSFASFDRLMYLVSELKG